MYLVHISPQFEVQPAATLVDLQIEVRPLDVSQGRAVGDNVTVVVASVDGA